MASVKSIILLLLSTVVLFSALAWWLDARTSTPELKLSEEFQNSQQLKGPLTPEENDLQNPTVSDEANPTAVMKTSLGTIKLELYKDLMPVTVANFVSLAEQGLYDSTTFHRVINGFMIQGGDITVRTDGKQVAPAKNITDEFVANELLTNTAGTIAMANTGQPNSGNSQWFINLGNNDRLDFDKQPFTSKHPVFGRVIEGWDVVEKIAIVEKTANSRGEMAVPVEPVIVESVTIE